MKNLGIILKKLRKEKDISQKEIANYLNISATTYSMYENEKRTPSLEIFKSIADFFNISSDFLLGLSQNEKKSEDVKKEVLKIDINYQVLKEINEREELQIFIEFLLNKPSDVVNKLYKINKLIVD